MLKKLVCGLLLAAALVAAAALFVPVNTSAGNWNYVCCGSGCHQDICSGSGQLICCKTFAL